MKIAILLAVSNYLSESVDNLPGCENDLSLMKDTLDASGEFHEVFTSLNEPKNLIEEKLIEFISKYKDLDISQVFFYFTGHGDRDKNDFYYCVSDLDLDNRSTTTLSNTVIDAYLKELSAKVTIKVIDACKSGQVYIKDVDNNVKDILRNSIETKGAFEEVYFMFSSKSNENSLATAKYSCFSKLFFEAISSQKYSEKITYKQIMDYLSDKGEATLGHTPIFVAQGAYKAYMFNNLTKSKAIIETNLKIESEEKNNAINKASLKDLIIEESKLYCSEKIAIERINTLFEVLKKYKVGSDLEELFDFEKTYFSYVPYNAIALGRWLDRNKKIDHYFANPHYKTLYQQEKKYVEVPENPNNPFASFASSLKKNYSLEEVTVPIDVLDGISYVVPLDKVASSWVFRPKENLLSLKTYMANFAIIFSKKTIVLFYSIEELYPITWKTTSDPKCSEWKIIHLNLKSYNENELLPMFKNIEKFILDDIRNSLINKE